MRIEIRPALQPIHRHKLELALQEIVEGVGKVDGGETKLDGTECSIYLYPLKGFYEADIRERLTGTTAEPPWDYVDHRKDVLDGPNAT